ncbi:putative sister chromatid cohesion protein Dcc1 [Aspergillus lucknowensis]|uniref:Sister chromatid cohesion protein Dcc1 n=1 Tax=Aspergillus lucknowensis TaxID=176173 RepID=A0ABR4LE10_9EURO
MSTQPTPSILFTHRSPQHGFRLLELPPELADLLASDKPPTLELKSPSQTSTKTSSSATTPEYVNLCTPTTTYSIRQVQSSNSLHILQPSTGSAVRRGDLSIVAEGDDTGSQDTETDLDRNLNIEGAVTTIAKCGSTLELHISPEGFSAEGFLRDVVRVYARDADGDIDMEMGGDEYERDEHTTRNILDRLFADIPVSRAQCERGWIQMCGFVLPPHAGAAAAPAASSYCWRPSSAMKLEVWKRVTEGAVLQAIDLGKQFLVKDLWKSVLDDDGLEPFPKPLFEAVVRRIRDEGDSPGISLPGSELKWASIDRECCVRWVGETYLEVMAPGAGSAVSHVEFLSSWKDQLPETWRDDVSLSILPEACYMHPDSKTVCFATEADRQKVKKNLPTDTSAATTAKKTRNWHELFKNQRQKR